MSREDLRAVLDIARWAPSGDNSQQWRLHLDSDKSFSFPILSDQKNVYNLLALPEYISAGMLLENAKIAAAKLGYKLDWAYEDKVVRATLSETPNYDNPLFPFIKTRSVNRYPYKLKKLSAVVKQAAQDVLDDDMKLVWIEYFADKMKIAKTLMEFADIRLRIPESYEIHRDMIDWSGQDSSDRMPASALGANPLSLMIMRWVLQKEGRNRFMMQLPGSTLSFQIELDLLPALMSGGHFMLVFDPKKTPNPTEDDLIRGGSAMQRVWLTLTQHRLVMQPWYIPIMFSHYIQQGIQFTKSVPLFNKTKIVSQKFLDQFLKPRDIQIEHIIFSGRVGYPLKTNIRRSVRKPLDSLIVEDYSS